MRLSAVFASKSSDGYPKLVFCCSGRGVGPGIRERRATLLFSAAVCFGAVLWAITAALWPLDVVFTSIGGAIHVLALSTFAFVMLSDPGIVPKNITSLFGSSSLKTGSFKPPENARHAEPVIADAAASKLLANAADLEAADPCMVKFCVTCRIWRPPTCHHCSVCDVCVLGFDHHCGVIGKCVGQGNIRAFLAFEWAQVLQYSYSFVYALVATVTGILENDGSDKVEPSAWAGASGQLGLWVAGGVVLGLIVCCSTCLRMPWRACTGTIVGLLAVGLAGIAGTACLLAAYGHVSPTAGRLSPAILSLPVYAWATFFATTTALGQTCTAARQETTKERIRQMVTSGPTGVVTRRSVSFGSRLAALGRLACSRAPSRLVDYHADVTELVKAINAVQNRLALEAEAREAAKLAAWKEAQQQGQRLGKGDQSQSATAVEVPVATGGDGTQVGDAAITVNPLASEAELAGAVVIPLAPADEAPQGGAQLGGHGHGQTDPGSATGTSSTTEEQVDGPEPKASDTAPVPVADPAVPDPAQAWAEACRAALVSSLDSGYVEDALVVLNDPDVLAAAAKVKGVVADSDSFLVPGLDYRALAALAR